ncbi:protein-disulfide reductase DsbD family protein [Sulfitobacter sp. D35]|uniref:protein-disulfide reductase DsbD domain-containing protein n=1 Tax=Sulfitobacter sp. D35 TaxID=3083252 RepID=UPI00296ECE6B|nr:protein-disulfide reductase DsbD domain-containing protein [Sulfitobacter sp. D35]MDW4499774.1 protein-disulfide reductase DsbD family protein [Sulfitobacter sp. D35]
MRKTTASLAAAILAIAATAFPVSAGGPEAPITASFLPGWVRADGSRVVALRMDLAKGWKTYWRAPGDAGIPPQFDWSGSRNLASVGVNWPTPVVFDESGMRSIGYKDRVVIPLTIAPKTPGAPVSLSLGLDMGICSDICIPHRLDISARIDTDATQPDPVIAAALAQVPYSAREAGVISATCAFSPSPDGLRIEARVGMPSAGGEEFMVIEPGQGGVWVSEADTRRNGGEVTGVSEMVQIHGEPLAVDRRNIRLTVLGRNHAVDIRGCTPG